MYNLKVTAEHLTSWDIVYRLALATEGKTRRRDVPRGWVPKILKAEHSPIRAKQYLIRIENCPTWVWTHLVRHKIGVEFFIQSQRDDRNENPVPRAEKPQGAPCNGYIVINAQALVNISRKRLCNKASKETRQVWIAVRNAIKEIDADMSTAMKPECCYRKFCPEMKPCNYDPYDEDDKS